MKFYRDNFSWKYLDKIENNKLTAIYCKNFIISFLKNGKYHNTKNVASISNTGVKQFYLNNKFYGSKYDFTKKSWRRFVKLQAFL